MISSKSFITDLPNGGRVETWKSPNGDWHSCHFPGDKLTAPDELWITPSWVNSDERASVYHNQMVEKVRQANER
jgi:hypothetical protein